MDPGHERGKLPDLCQAHRLQILLASGKELHAHRWRIEPIARAAEVVQLRGCNATHVLKGRSLALSMSELGGVAAEGDSDYNVPDAI
jgi:hypothetical protein